jgi:phage N-6-adenine-methyltransferase
MSINRGMFTSNKDEYGTPQNLYDELDKEFHFLLDAAASPGNAKNPNYYTKEDDALSLPWDVTTFCNPPYGREIGKFVGRAWRQSVVHGVEIVMLLPARTDTKWWHDYVRYAAEIRFIRGRLSFEGSNGPAPFPSCIVVFDWSMASEPQGVYYIDREGCPIPDDIPF